MNESTQAATPSAQQSPALESPASRVPVTVLAYVWVGVPFAWGVYELILKARNLFGA